MVVSGEGTALESVWLEEEGRRGAGNRARAGARGDSSRDTIGPGVPAEG